MKLFRRRKKGRFVIICAGASGSGKTRLTLKLTEMLGNATSLFYDHYSHLQDWSMDFDDWFKSGADPTVNIIPQMKSDLEQLLAGKSIINPTTGKKIRPAKYIVIEDPYGKCRDDIGPHADFVVLLDIPLEVSFTWTILRCFKGKFLREDGSLVEQEDVDTRDKLALIEKFLTGEYFTRDYYLALNELVREHANLIITDLEPTEEIAKKVLHEIKGIQQKKV